MNLSIRLFLFIFFLSHALWAEPPPPPEGTAASGGFTSTLLEQHKRAAEAIDSMSIGLDKYLSGLDETNEKNRSAVIFKNGFFWREGGVTSKSFHIDLKIHLPKLQEKWALRFTSYDDDDDERGINRRRLKTGPKEESYSTSVAFFKRLGDVDVTFRPKVQIKKTVETSHLLKFSSKAKTKYFLLRPRLELFGRSDTGTGELVGLDFEYELGPKHILVLANEQEYVDFENKYSTNHELALGHGISATQSMKYAALYESHNKPAFHLVRYTYYVTYGHTLYKDLLRYSLTPNLVFAEEEKFSGAAGLNAGLDIIF
jgi:hypothetical protein